MKGSVILVSPVGELFLSSRMMLSEWIFVLRRKYNFLHNSSDKRRGRELWDFVLMYLVSHYIVDFVFHLNMRDSSHIGTLYLLGPGGSFFVCWMHHGPKICAMVYFWVFVVGGGGPFKCI